MSSSRAKQLVLKKDSHKAWGRYHSREVELDEETAKTLLLTLSSFLPNSIVTVTNTIVQEKHTKMIVLKYNLSKVLFRNEGKWHKKCRLSYNENKLSRLCKKAVKRTVSSPETCGESSGFEPATRKVLRRSYNSANFQVTCFFCDSDEDTLHKIMDLVVSNRVRDIACETEDTKILAKLSEGDMIAIEALYHCKCLVAYYNKSRTQKDVTDNPIFVVWPLENLYFIFWMRRMRIQVWFLN